MKFTHTTGDQPVKGYTIQRGIGRGGFGEVYQAISDGGKEVALKLVQRNLNVEMRGVGHCLNVKHTNLVSLYDIRQSDSGDTWVVMEYVAGGSLDQVIARHQQGMKPEEAIFWLRGLCAGVGYLHEHGIVHRDLKPGNIFFEGGIVKIGDYGLSKFISASRRSGQTESVGTVHYMAPEVSMGRYNREVDLYAIGVLFYEMLTGRVPFDGESPGEILMKHLAGVPDLTPLPEDFRPIIGRLLEKDPQKRYPSVEALLEALPDVKAWSGAPTSAYRPVPPISMVTPGPETQPYHSALFDSRLRQGVQLKAQALLQSCVRAFIHPEEEAEGAPFARLGREEKYTALIRLLVAAVLGVGAGLMSGGMALVVQRDEAAATFMGLGVGFLTAGVMARNLLSQILFRVWWRGLVPLLMGLGGGFFVGGVAEAIFPIHSDAAPFFGIGAGLLLAARFTFRMFPSSRHILRWRALLAVFQGAGILFLAMGAAQLFGKAGSDAPLLMGIGSGLLVAGFFGYRMVLRGEIKPRTSTVSRRETSVGVVVAEEVHPNLV